MKASTTGIFISALLIAIPTASADEGLLKKSGCSSCHAVDKKGMGPALKDIAAKYHNDENAHSYLAGKIKSGSKGVWGKMIMPAQSRISDENIDKLVDYILSLK